MRTYQDVYPSQPLLRSADLTRPRAADLLSLEYFEAEPAEMETDVFAQHHVLLNLKDEPQRVENIRDGELRDFIFEKDEIVVTPAGMQSGWRWFVQSKCIMITLDPVKLERFAESEVGVLLTGTQLQNLPQFKDPDICQAGVMVRDALAAGGVGAEVMFDALARVFLVKLIQKYAERSEEDIRFSARFTAKHYKRVQSCGAPCGHCPLNGQRGWPHQRRPSHEHHHQNRNITGRPHRRDVQRQSR